MSRQIALFWQKYFFLCLWEKSDFTNFFLKNHQGPVPEGLNHKKNNGKNRRRPGGGALLCSKRNGRTYRAIGATREVRQPRVLSTYYIYIHCTIYTSSSGFHRWSLRFSSKSLSKAQSLLCSQARRLESIELGLVLCCLGHHLHHLLPPGLPRLHEQQQVRQRMLLQLLSSAWCEKQLVVVVLLKPRRMPFPVYITNQKISWK